MEITAPAPEAVTNRRSWIILSLLFAITVINFVDRQTLSILAPLLRQTLHLSNQQYGRVVSAFQFGMMSGEFPMGYLMDRWGTRLGVSVAVLWWSTATGAQIFSRSGLSFGLVRYWMGTGECGNISGGVKTVTRLFAKKDRTLAIGIFNSGTMIGATIAPPLIIFLMQRYGFRAAFLVPAFAGVVWVPFWWFAHRNEPKHVQESGAEHISSRKLLSSSSAWAVMACRFFNGPVLQFYWYWIPSYLFGVRHLSMTQLGLLGWMPFLVGDVGGVAGGWAAGFLQRRGLSTLNVRRVTLYGSSLLCISSLVVPHMNHAGGALIMIGIAVMADNFYSANMYGAITDLFPVQQVGRVTGFTGIAGGLSGLLFPLLTGWLIDHVSYTPVFLLIAFMPAVGAIALFALGRRYRDPELRLTPTEIAAEA